MTYGRDPPVVLVVLGVATGADEQAAVGLGDLEERPQVVQVVLVSLRALEQRVVLEPAGVEPRDVARVDPALERLQPVRLLPALRGEGLPRRNVHELELAAAAAASPGRPGASRGCRRPCTSGYAVSRTLRAKLLFSGSEGTSRHWPVDVVLPAVVGAPDAALLDVAEPERRAPMRAELVDQAVLALAVAERDQPLGEDLHPTGGAVVLGQLLGEQRRDPVPAKQVARRRSRAPSASEAR